MSNGAQIESIIKDLECIGIRDPAKDSIRVILKEFENPNFDYSALCPNLSVVIDFIIEDILSIEEKDSENKTKHLNTILSIMKSHRYLFEFPSSDPESNDPRIQFSIRYLTQLINLTQDESGEKFEQTLQLGLIHFIVLHQAVNRGSGAEFNLDDFNFAVLLFYLKNIILSINDIEDKDTSQPSLLSKSINDVNNPILNQSMSHLSENYQNRINKISLNECKLKLITKSKESLQSTFRFFSEVIEQTMIKKSEPSRLVPLINIYLQFSFQTSNLVDSLLFNICIAINLKILNLLTPRQPLIYHSFLTFISFLKYFLKDNYDNGFKISERSAALELINKNIEDWVELLGKDENCYDDSIISLYSSLEEILICPSFKFISIQIQKSFINLMTTFFDKLPDTHSINEKTLSILLELSLNKDLLLIGFDSFIKYYKLALKLQPTNDMTTSGLGRRERNYYDSFMDFASKRFKASYDSYSPDVPGSPNGLFGHSDVDAITELYNELPNTFEFALVNQLVRLFIDFFVESERREFQVDIDHVIILKKLVLACLVDQPSKSNILKYIERLLDIYFKFVIKSYVKTLSKTLAPENPRKSNVISLYTHSIQIANCVALQNSPSKSTLLLTLIPFISTINSKEFFKFYQLLNKNGIISKNFDLNQKLKEVKLKLDSYCLVIDDFQNLPILEILNLSLTTLCNHSWGNDDEDQSLVTTLLTFIPIKSTNFSSDLLNTWWRNLSLILKQQKFQPQFLSFLNSQIENSNSINLNNLHSSSIIAGLKNLLCAWSKSLSLSNHNSKDFEAHFKIECSICDSSSKKAIKPSCYDESIDMQFIQLLGLIDSNSLLPSDKRGYLQLIESFSKHSPNLEKIIENENLRNICILTFEQSKDNLPLYISKIFIPIFDNPDKKANSQFINPIYDLLTNFIENEPNSNALEIYIKCLGCIISGIDLDHMLPPLILLLKAFIRSETRSVQLVCTQFRLLFANKGIKEPFILISQFLTDISHCLIQILIQSPKKLSILANLFKVNSEDFINISLKSIFPLALDKYSSDIEKLLILSNIQTEEIWENFSSNLIVYYIIHYTGDWIDKLTSSFSFIKQLSLEDIKNQVIIDLNQIINNLIFIDYQVGNGSDQEILNRVKCIYSLILNNDLVGEEEILRFLNSFFLSYLTFTYDLCTSNYLNSKKVNNLRNLKKLLIMLNFSIETYFYQICSLFSELTQFKPLHYPLYRIMENLPKLLSDETLKKYLNHFISIISANLNNFENDIRHDLIRVIDDIVRKKKSLIRETLKWLPYFSEEYSELKSLQNNLSENITNKDPTQVIPYYVNIINENTILSCETGLDGLWNYISINNNSIQSFLNETPLPQFVNQLFISLFNIFHDDLNTTESSKILAAKILGKLGATDLDLLINNEINSDIPIVFHAKKLSDWVPFFKGLLGKILIPKFQLSLTYKHQMAYSFGIQEIIKTLEFRKLLKISNPNDLDVNLRILAKDWGELVEGNENIMYSLLQSQFNIKNLGFIKKSPINPHCDSFEQWLSNWCLSLIEKLEDPVASQIFKSLIGIIQIPDIQLLTTIFPHVIYHSIKGGNKNALNLIINEVRSAVENAPNHDRKEDPNYIKYHTSLKFILKLFSALGNMINLIRDHYDNSKNNRNNQVLYLELKKYLENSYQGLKEITQCIGNDELGRASLMVDDLASSIRYLEYFYRKPNKTLSEKESKKVLSELEEVYCKIGDRDSVIGISKNLGDKPEDLQVSDHLNLEDWEAARVWYDAAHQKDPANPDYKLGLIDANRIQGNHLVVESLYDSFISTDIPTTYKLKMEDCALESSWKKVNLTRLRKHIQHNSSSNTFNSALGKIMISLNSQRYDEVLTLIETARKNLIPHMGFMGGNLFHGLRSSLTQLHMLDDVDYLINNCNQDYLNLESVSKYWKEKLSHTPPTFKHRESVLSLSRSLTQLTQPLTHSSISIRVIDELYINSIKSARHAEYISIAQSMMAHVSKEKQWEVQIQDAKCKWYFGEKTKAIELIENTLKTCGVKAPSAQEIQAARVNPKNQSHSFSKNHQYYPWAKLTLLNTKWLHEISGKAPGALMPCFEDICSIFPNFSKAWYNLSQLSIDITHEILASQRLYTLQQVINATITSIKYSRKTLSDYPQYNQLILPRVINLVIEVANHLSKNEIPIDPSTEELRALRHTIFRSFNSLIDVLNPKSLFYVFNQAACGICHDFSLLGKCFINLSRKVLLAYPHQSLWNLAPMLLSDDKNRKDKALSIIYWTSNESQDSVESPSKFDEIISLYGKYSKLWNFLKRLSTSQSALPELIKNGLGWKYDGSSLLIPLQSTLSRPGLLDTMPRIKEIDKKSILVMSSLAKPIKFSFISDQRGKAFTFLCKPNDDLRKDARVMEFNSMLNRLFCLEDESKKRSLKIKTYAVLALGTKYGIIEWVENTGTIKSLINKYYKIPTKDLIKYRDDLAKIEHPSEKAAYFTKNILPSSPIVLHLWYYNHFSDPKKWYAARLNYARSLAVMSMVGYILGLGDRHSENVLIDITTGGILHIDFNCIFEAGKSLPIPEVVPFRLTRNLVNCLGPSNVEGPFRISCEVTMTICRKYHKTLSSVLQAFMADPLVEWGKVKQQPDIYKSSKDYTSNNSKDYANNNSKDYINNKATEFLEPIKNKLQGTETSNSPILISQQVQALIAEAMNIENLASMFIGWGAYY